MMLATTIAEVPGAGAPGSAAPPGMTAAPSGLAAAPGMTAAPSGLAGAHAPPFSLPMLHFGAALLFLLAGAAGLVLVAPQLTAGAYLSTRVGGVTHLFTLGWITTSIMGALYQFLPVALGRPVRWVRLAYVTYALYVPGLASFVGGMLAGNVPVMLWGAAALGAGTVLFIVNLAATLWAAERRDVTWWSLALATFFLLCTLVIGVALAGNLKWGYVATSRGAAIGVHLHIAVAGWVLLVMIGVANRLLPMFLLSHGVSDRLARASVVLVSAGAGMLALLHHAPPLVGRWLPALLVTAGTAAFLLQARSYYRRRHRPQLDPGMRLAAASLGVLGVALAGSWPAIFWLGSARLQTAYVMAVLLAISLFVAAHYYKIVPFLVWYHRYAALAGRRAVPRVSDLYSVPLAWTAAAALFTGAVALIAAVVAGATTVATAAALLFGSGVVVETYQLMNLGRGVAAHDGK